MTKNAFLATVILGLPGRFNSLYGAGRAAEAAGRRDVAERMYGALLAQCVAGSPRAELAKAKEFGARSRVALEESALRDFATP
jgi:hypothetical protein